MLSEAQLQYYKDNGYLLLDNVYTPAEIDECSDEYDTIFELKNKSELEATWKGDWKDEASVYTLSTVLL